MKKIIICSALLFTFFSCSKEPQSVQSTPAPDGTAIAFNSSLNQSIVRGTPVEGTKLKENFGVFGYCDKNKEENINIAMEHLYPNYMYNQKVDYHNGNNPYFSYSPITYWPTEGWINFFAYAPYHPTTPEFEHPKNPTDKGYPVIKYEVKKTVKDQEDLMIAEALKQVGTSPTVNFNFQHTLAKIGVKGCLESNCDDLVVYIKKVEFKNIKDKGEFYYSHLSGAKKTWWECVEGSANYNIGLDKENNHRAMSEDADQPGRPKFDGVVIGNNEVCRINEKDEYLLAMPQCFDENCKAVIEVVYCISDKDGRNGKDYTVNIPLKNTQCWDPGTCIDYVICIELNGVKFSAEITPWTDCEEVTTDVNPGGELCPEC